ncbi:MAG: hypothetical protein LC776_00135 [Acidobacteria bacterium]|nr:hypothetical protein [Acidobacteriota bacterium]
MIGTAHNSPRQPNNVLVECRTTLGLSHEKLAYLVREKAREKNIQIGTLDSVTRHIKRIEAGHVRDPSVVYKDLLCAVLRKAEAALFGTVSPHRRHGDMPTGPSGQADHFQVRNHKLIPAFIGAGLAERLIDDLAMRATSIYSMCCYHCPLDHARNEVSADLWIWPFGVALFRLVEVVEFPSLAQYAIWHRRVYDEQMDWANQKIKSLLQSDASAQYAMPINWITRSVWPRSQLGTALRILSAPRILLQRTAQTESSDLVHAELVERALFHDGLDQFDSSEFGVEGISAGVASWSGVVYLPLASHRALSESEVLTYECTVQAAWSYCDWIRTQVELGNEPHVRHEHGTRLLRALRSIITNPRPEESSQTYPLRGAILETSGITEHLNQAMDTTLGIEG